MMHNAKPVVLITGATSQVGVAACRSLNAKFNDMVEIRAGIRNPLKALKLNPLACVSQVPFDTNNLETLMANLRGVERLCIIPPNKENRVDIVKFIIDEALKAGVNFICLQSILVANTPKKFSFGKDFSEMEDYLKACGVKFTILRSNLFMENYLLHRYELVDQRQFNTPLKESSRVSFIACQDLGLAIATVLANPIGFEGRTFNMSGPEALSQGELHMLFEAILGGPIKFSEVSMSDRHSFFTRRTLMPEWQAKGFEELLKGARGSDGIMSIVHDDFSLVTGVRGTAFREWLLEYKEEFLHPIDLAAERLKEQQQVSPMPSPAPVRTETLLQSLDLGGIEAEIRKITLTDLDAAPRGVRAASGPFGERLSSEVGEGLSTSGMEALGAIGQERVTEPAISVFNYYNDSAAVLPTVECREEDDVFRATTKEDTMTTETGLPTRDRSLLPSTETLVSSTGAQGAHGLPLTNQTPAMSRSESISPVSKNPTNIGATEEKTETLVSSTGAQGAHALPVTNQTPAMSRDESINPVSKNATDIASTEEEKEKRVMGS